MLDGGGGRWGGRQQEIGRGESKGVVNAARRQSLSSPSPLPSLPPLSPSLPHSFLSTSLTVWHVASASCA